MMPYMSQVALLEERGIAVDIPENPYLVDIYRAKKATELVTILYNFPFKVAIKFTFVFKAPIFAHLHHGNFISSKMEQKKLENDPSKLIYGAISC